MATTSSSVLMRKLHRAALLPDGAGLTDGQLLERFLSHGDESAFEVLVRRHGPMVFAVCKRVGGNPHDAEDCFRRPVSWFSREKQHRWRRRTQ